MALMDASLRRNLFSLFLLQGGNYLIPLITLPWLSRALGTEGYGTVGFVMAFVTYFSLLVDWGFNLSATRLVAIHRENRDERSRVFWSTLYARLLLSGLGALLLFAILNLWPSLNIDADFFWVGFLAVLGVGLSPAFYLQGIEKMGVMSMVNLTVRVLSIPLIFYWVHGKEDLMWAIGIQSGCSLLAPGLNLSSHLLSGEVAFIRPRLTEIRSSIKAGGPLFLSTASISLYTNSNVVLLGLLADSTAVGLFTAAQTVIRAGQGVFSPIAQALFPRMSHLFHSEPENAHLALRKCAVFQVALSAIFSVATFFLAPSIVKLLFGPIFAPATEVLEWLSPLLFLIGLSNVFGVQAMVPLGYNRAFTRILFLSGIINISLILPLSYCYGAPGAALSVLICELWVTSTMGFFIVLREPQLFWGKRSGIKKVTQL